MSVKISHFIPLCPSTVQFSSVQSLSHVQLFAIPWTAAHQASLYITNSQTLLKLTSIKLVMPSNHLILCPQLLLPLSIFPSIRVFLMSQFFSSGGQSIGIPASALFLPVNIQDWFSLGWTGCTFLQSLKSLHQHHSSKALILHCLAFFLMQLSHPYMTTTLTRWTFVGNIMSLLFNMLSRLVIAFLPRSKHLLISWLQAPNYCCSDFEAQENKVFHSFHCFPIYLPWSDGTRCHDLSFLNVEL